MISVMLATIGTITTYQAGPPTAGNRHQRYTSSTPTTGLSAYTHWRCWGMIERGYTIGVMNSPTWIMNGTTSATSR